MVGCPHQEDKALSGLEQSRWMTGLRSSTTMLRTSKAKENGVSRLDTSIGRLSSTSRKRDLSSPSKGSSLLERIMNSPVLPRPKNMSGKKTPEFQEASLKLESNPSYDLEKPTGMKSGNPQEAETSWLSPLMYEVLNLNECNVIATSDELGLILQSLLPLNVEFTYFGVLPVLENPEGHGMRRVSLLTLRVPLQSSGMVTKIKKMLSSMNLEEISASLTCYDGWTDTPCWLKLRDQASYCLLAQSGSQATCRLPAGILLWMRTLPLLCCED